MTADGLLTFGPEVAPLEYTSPTRYVALRQCALREMWGASGAPQLLPSFPAARVGSVIHQLLEDAGQGAFPRRDALAVDQRWQALIAEVEERMLASWLERHFVPLSLSVPDFEVRRIQARERALELSDTVSETPDRPTGASDGPVPLHGCEVPVSTLDRRVRGRIDAVAPSRDGPVVRDYKSGAIFEPGAVKEHVLKEAYEIQLRMYAALYAVTSGRWPARLEVVPILGTPEPVTFDAESCNALVEAAREALDNVNQAIRLDRSSEAVQERLANPRPEVCAYCTFRPGCLPYRGARVAASGQWPHDVSGRLKGIATLADGSAVMEIDCAAGMIRIRGLSLAGRHPALEILQQGDAVAVYNARPTGSPAMLAESPFTVIYKMPEPFAQSDEAAAGTPA